MTITVTKRSVKGTPLSRTELDANFQELADLSSTATDDGTKGFHHVHYPPLSGETGIENYAFARDNVLRFIPISLHDGIRDASNATELTTYIQNAAVSVNGGTAGAGTGGTVHVPDGTYLTDPIGMRGTVFRGQSMKGTIIKPFSTYSAGQQYLFDAALDRDGTTANTSGNGGIVQNMTIDGDSKGYHGVRTYGGGVFTNSLTITGCVDGYTGSLLIWSFLSSIYSNNNSGNNFTVDGDSTSTQFVSCWSDTAGAKGWEIKRMTYSSFINCASQNCVEQDWYVGDSTGTNTCYSLSFISCGSESSGDVPFYFKKCRNLSIISPRIISASATHDYIVFDNCGGSIYDYSHIGTPGAGKFSLSIINHSAGDGAISFYNSVATVTASTERYWNSTGSSINSSRGIQDYKVTFNSATAANVMDAQVVSSVDGFGGVEFSENSGGTRVAAFSRLGANVFRGIAFNNAASNMNNSEFSIAVDTAGATLTFTMKDTTGTVKTGTIAMT